MASFKEEGSVVAVIGDLYGSVAAAHHGIRDDGPLPQRGSEAGRPGDDPRPRDRRGRADPGLIPRHGALPALSLP